MSIISSRNSVSQRNIAEALGISQATVSYGLKNGISYIVDKAAELGYISESDKVLAKAKHRYYGGNFTSKEEEVERMKELRSQGYSNAEIAAKVGRSAVTVFKAIGKGDPALAKMNRIRACHHRAEKNRDRRAYIVAKKVLEYYDKKNEYIEALKKAAALKEEVQKLGCNVDLNVEIPEFMQ